MTTGLLTLAMAGNQGQSQGQSSPFGMLFPMIIIFAIFYFMLIRPQQRREKERRAMISETKTGDRVIFCGGIMGTVSNVKEHTFMVKIADGVKIEVARGAVSRVMDKGEKLDGETETK